MSKPYSNPFELKHFRPEADGGLVEKFLSTYENRQTRRNYRTDLKQFFGGDPVGRSRVEQIGREDIIRFLREKSSLARSTLKRKLETLRSFFEWLRDRGVLQERPIGKEETTTGILDEVLQENGDASRDDSFQTEWEGADQKGEQSGSPGAPSENRLGTYGQEGSEPQAPPPSLKDFETTGRSTDAEKSGGEGRREGEGYGGVSAGLPQWIVDRAREAYGNLDLTTEQRVPLRRLPSALRSVLREIVDSEPPSGLGTRSLRYDPGLSIEIFYFDSRPVIEAKIRSDLLQRAQDEISGSLLDAALAYDEISYLMERGWALPSELRNKVLGPTGAPPSRNLTPVDCPVWREEPANSPNAQFRVATEIAGALAEAFGISKDEEITIRPRL